jgi:predicted permease
MFSFFLTYKMLLFYYDIIIILKKNTSYDEGHKEMKIKTKNIFQVSKQSFTSPVVYKNIPCTVILVGGLINK